jgi:hypothetical protein
MIIRNLIWGSLALLGVFAMTAAQAAPSSADEDAVTAAEQQWLQSQQTNNTELLSPLLADKVIETTEDGKVRTGKVAVIADAKTDTWSSAAYTDLKVTVLGHTAIATGSFTGKRTDASGHTIDARARFTDTRVEMSDGKWLCVATHDSRLKM